MRHLVFPITFGLVLAACGGGGDADAVKKTAEVVDELTDDPTGGTTDDTVDPPAAPTGLAASAQIQGAAVSWKAAKGADKYILRRSTTAGANYTEVYTGTKLSYADTGLTPGLAYYYVVQAENAGGASDDSAEATVTPLYPAAPAPATVSVVGGDAELRVYWAGSAGAVSYQLQRQTEGGAYTAVVTQTATSYVDAAVANGTVYGYRVLAANPDGALTASTTATGKPYQFGRQICVPAPAGVQIYDAAASGVVAPARTIAAPRMFTNPTDLAVDTARGRVYVLDSVAGSVAVYGTAAFANNPVFSTALAAIPAAGAAAITVDTGLARLYVLSQGAITAYDISTATPAFATSVNDAINLLLVPAIAAGNGEVYTAHVGGSIRRYDATTLALIGVISDASYATLYSLVNQTAIEYIGFNDRIAVLDAGGRVRLYNRDSTGNQSPVVPMLATGYNDVRDLAYERVSKQVWVLRNRDTFSNVYAYDVTTLTARRNFSVADALPLAALEIDSANNRYYTIFGNDTIGVTNGVVNRGPTGFDAKSADQRIIASTNGMLAPSHVGVDLVNQEVYLRNRHNYLTVFSLAPGATSALVKHAYRWSGTQPRGFTGDIAVSPANGRVFSEDGTDAYWFSRSFTTVVNTGATVRTDVEAPNAFTNLSINESENRLYTFDGDPDSFSSVNVRGFTTSGDIRTSETWKALPVTNATSAVVAYANFAGGGEVIVLDPVANFGWVLTTNLATIKRTFKLDSLSTSPAGIVADAANQEVYVVRDGLVSVYRKAALTGAGVQPVRTLTIAASAGTASVDVDLCK